MADKNTILRERQLVIAREMQRRGIALKAVALDAELSVSTVRSYFPGERDAVPAVMPTSVLYALLDTGALPVDLLSLLLPDGFQIVKVPENIDHDELARHCRSFVNMKGEAHHPDSECGREIGPNENVALLRAAVQLRGVAA